MVIVNVGHVENNDDLEKALAATIRRAFPHLARFPIEDTNTLVVASERPLDVGQISPAPAPGSRPRAASRRAARDRRAPSGARGRRRLHGRQGAGRVADRPLDRRVRRGRRPRGLTVFLQACAQRHARPPGDHDALPLTPGGARATTPARPPRRARAPCTSTRAAPDWAREPRARAPSAPPWRRCARPSPGLELSLTDRPLDHRRRRRAAARQPAARGWERAARLRLAERRRGGLARSSGALLAERGVWIEIGLWTAPAIPSAWPPAGSRRGAAGARSSSRPTPRSGDRGRRPRARSTAGSRTRARGSCRSRTTAPTTRPGRCSTPRGGRGPRDPDRPRGHPTPCPTPAATELQRRARRRRRASATGSVRSG